MFNLLLPRIPNQVIMFFVLHIAIHHYHNIFHFSFPPHGHPCHPLHPFSRARALLPGGMDGGPDPGASGVRPGPVRGSSEPGGAAQG